MSTPQHDPPATPNVPSKYIFGPWVVLEGGEVDTTIYPSQFAAWEAALSQQPVSKPESMPSSEDDPID